MNSPHRRQPVRPRWVWSGTAIGVVGFVVLGVAVALASWWLALAGAVLAAGGVAAARHGRIMQDVQGGGSSDPAGPEPGDTIDDAAARADAVQTTGKRRAVQSLRAPRRRFGGIEAALMLGAAAVLLGAQLSLYPSNSTGEGDATAMILPTVIFALCGIRLATDTTHRHRAAGLLAFVTAVGTVLFALLAHHQEESTWVLELACGGVALLAATGTVVEGGASA